MGEQDIQAFDSIGLGQASVVQAYRLSSRRLQSQSVKTQHAPGHTNYTTCTRPKEDPKKQHYTGQQAPYNYEQLIASESIARQ